MESAKRRLQHKHLDNLHAGDRVLVKIGPSELPAKVHKPWGRFIIVLLENGRTHHARPDEIRLES